MASYEKNTFSKNKYNVFSSGDKKKAPLIFKSLKSDFPELSSSIKRQEIDAPDSLPIKFNEIVKIEHTQEDDTNKNNIPDGYVCFSLGKHNKIDIEYGPNTEPLKNINDPDEDHELSPAEIMNTAIDIMIENMERYKMDFIERNGEDEYNRIYNYNKDTNMDGNEEEDEDYYNSENEDGYDYY